MRRPLFISRPSPAFLSVVALALGLAGGLGADSSSAPVRALVGGLDTVARAWTNALQLIVVPLVVSQLFLAIAAAETSGAQARRIGVSALLVFLGLLSFGAVLTLLVTQTALGLPGLRSLSMLPSGGHPSAPASPVGSASDDAARWIDDFVPSNLFAVATTPNILPLILFTGVFAVAARRLTPELRHGLEVGFRGVADSMFVVLGWLMAVAPIVVFAVTFRVAGGGALRVGGVLLAFVLVSSAMFLLTSLALYPLAIALGRVRFGRFARALVPGQIVAVMTRSSVATVPVLMQSADQTLRIPLASSAYVVPLAGATLKISRAVYNTLTILFIAHLLGLHLTSVQLLIFIVSVLLLSPATPGVPSVRSGQNSLPAYVAVGIPAEYVVWLGTTTAVTDVFQTILNTTGYMTANVLVNRFIERSTHEAPVIREDSPAGVAHTPTADGSLPL